VGWIRWRLSLTTALAVVLVSMARFEASLGTDKGAARDVAARAKVKREALVYMLDGGGMVGCSIKT
jgi:hypothetical protein